MNVCMYDRFLTLDCALMFAPLSMSRAATSEYPLQAAAIRGVHPFYQRHTSTLIYMSSLMLLVIK